MGLLTPIDRLLHAGGTGVTIGIWVAAIVAALAALADMLPMGIAPTAIGLATTVGWMRHLGLTIGDLLVRIGLTELR